MLLLLPGRDAYPQASPVMQLARVQLVGAQRFSPEDVTQLSGLAIGKTVTVGDLNDAAQRLANTGFFETVKYRYTLAGRRVTVVYEIRETPWTVPVSFDNFVWFSDADIVQAVRRDIPTFDGTLPKSHEMPDLMMRALQKLLETRKIPGRVEFTPQATLAGGEILQYLFAVRDPAPTVCDVQVSGASVIPEKGLVNALRSAGGADYSRFSVANIVKGTLTEMYRRQGYWRASFDAPATSLTDGAACTGVRLALAVTEGDPYTFAATQWSGNTAVPSAQLEAAFGMKPGDIADVSKVEAGLRAARREYGRHGHLAMRSSYSPRLDDDAKRATFQIQVTEGPQFRMGTFEVVGLPPTDVDALTKLWRLQAGDPYDEEYARAFQSKDVMALWRARRGAGKPPQMQTQVVGERRVVNVRIVAQ